MISWTVAGSVPFLTGITEVVGSSSYSSSGSADRAEPDNATGSGSYTALSTYSYGTTHGLDGSTTYFSSSSSSSLTDQWGLTVTPNPDTVPDETYAESESNSGSSSGQTTAELLTALVETSTTETYSSFYDTFTTTTVVADGEEIGFVDVWTTSSGEDGALSFYQSNGTVRTIVQVAETTREATRDTTTTSNQTITLSALPNTIVQAETRYAQNAEILYAITTPVSDVTAYSAATNLAQSGTRFTLSPQVVTAEKTAADYSRPTSSIASTEQTSVVLFARSTTTQQVATEALYTNFPPSTFTATRSAVTTTNTTWATNYLSAQNNLTHGATTNTVTAKSFGTYWKIVSNQIGTRSFQTAVVSTTTWTVTLPVEAAASSSVSESSNPEVTISIWYGLTTNLGNAASATFYSSAVTANTLLPTVKATTGVGGQPAQTKYGTVGAAIGSQKGGWITANASSEGGVDFTWIYALDGSGRRATTMFPVTNQYQTVNNTGITWTRSTSAVLSIDGATSKVTTTSASFGVSGATQTTAISQPIGHFGGQAGSQETFVQTASPGAYKNRVNGSTTSFDGAATLLSNGATASIASWAAIKDIRGLASTITAMPITWVESRNSTALPPAMPPDA